MFMIGKSVARRVGDGVDRGSQDRQVSGASRPKRKSVSHTQSWRSVAVRLLLIVMAALGGWPALLQAELKPESAGRIEALGPPSPHTILYFLFDASPELSKYVLFDADTLETKAWISTGTIPALSPSPDGRTLYVADTWMNGPQLLRSDVISFYDTRDYSFSGKIDMPENRRAILGPQFRTAVVHEGRFLLVLNFKPGSGITVVDTTERRVVADIDTPGCTLLYPTGKRSVSLICGNGSLLTLELDDNGQLTKQARSEPFFDPDVDPVMENAAVIAGTWFFPSYSGDVYPVDLSGELPVFRERWSLVDRNAQPAAEPQTAGLLSRVLGSSKQPVAEEDGVWRPGGTQYIAAHAARGELYVLMHPVAMSGDHDHAFPGTEVWVYDAASQVLKRRITLKDMANTVYVTADDNPIMVTSGISLLHGSRDSSIPPAKQVIPPVSNIQVYDAATGEFLREAMEMGMTYHFFDAPGSGGAR